MGRFLPHAQGSTIRVYASKTTLCVVFCPLKKTMQRIKRIKSGLFGTLSVQSQRRLAYNRRGDRAGDRPGLDTRVSFDLAKDLEIGAYAGVSVVLAESLSLYAEYQYAGDWAFLGLGLDCRF